MNIRQIKALAQLLEATGLTALEVCEGDTKVRLERLAATAVAELPPRAVAAAKPAPKPLETEDAPLDFNKLTEVVAPMIGVFYAAPAPGAEPFVKRGDTVKKGDVLCVIEAMKLLNEIVAETDGKIADICVQNGQVVEFSQTLFKLF